MQPGHGFEQQGSPLWFMQGRLAGFDPNEPFPWPKMFHYNGNPITPQEASSIITKRRAEWRYDKLERHRDFDESQSGLWRQLWAMIRGRL